MNSGGEKFGDCRCLPQPLGEKSVWIQLKLDTTLSVPQTGSLKWLLGASSKGMLSSLMPVHGF